jgi:hypothetical protein
MEAMAFDPTSIRHGITYAKFSRTKSIESLFLLKPLIVKNFKVKKKILLEMECLQSNAQWKFENETTVPNTIPKILLCTLNLIPCVHI